MGWAWYSTVSLWPFGFRCSDQGFFSILDTWTDPSVGFLILGSVPFLPDTCSQITLKLSLTKSLKAKQLCGRIQLHIENSCFQAFSSLFFLRKRRISTECLKCEHKGYLRKASRGLWSAQCWVAKALAKSTFGVTCYSVINVYYQPKPGTQDLLWM